MRTKVRDISNEKENGRIYTPTFMVDNILELSGYLGQKIIGKHVIDNSCGDGAFLCQIVARYCKVFFLMYDDSTLLKKHLETYIHGIDIDCNEQKKCIAHLSETAASFGVYDVKWDVLCADAMMVDKFNGKMDYVLGNPPYVRVHNLGDNANEVKKFSFSQNGMSDLFIVFFELGIKMLSPSGVLGYITPSSYFNSIAGGYMRRYLIQNKLLKAVVDLQHFQAFPATAYTAITILQNDHNTDHVDFYRYDPEILTPFYVDTLTSEEYCISDNYHFASKEALDVLKRIYGNCEKSDISVKNGYATLCDPVFINDFDFVSPFLIPVIKASKGIRQTIFYPYDKSGLLAEEAELKNDAPLYEYLSDNKERLLKRSREKDDDQYWYAFGRSQAIHDTFCEKMTLNSLIRNEEDLKFASAPAGTGVYGGLYVISKTIPLEEIAKVLRTKEFITYVSLLGKYKSGGYYTFSSKDVKRYLDYKFAYQGGTPC